MEFEPSLVGWTTFERGVWEPEQTEMILSMLRPGATVLNVGANTGYYALLAAEKVGRQGHVYAFEIQPAILAILRRNVALNGFDDVVTVIPSGCFSAPGEAMIESDGDPVQARIALQTGDGIRVPLTTIDLFVAGAELRCVDIILIDTEGADFEVLKGSEHLLERDHPTVIAEVHLLNVFGGSDRELITFMERFGYRSTELSSEYSRDLLFVAEK